MIGRLHALAHSTLERVALFWKKPGTWSPAGGGLRTLLAASCSATDAQETALHMVAPMASVVTLTTTGSYPHPALSLLLLCFFGGPALPAPVSGEPLIMGVSGEWT